METSQTKTKARIVALEERVLELEDQKAGLLDALRRLVGLQHALSTVSTESAEVVLRAIRDANKAPMPF